MLVRARQSEVEYSVDHWGDQFVVLTNLDAPDFRVMTAPLDRPGEWSELLPHVPGRRFTTVQPFAGHLVLHEWSDAQPKALVLFPDGRQQALDFGDEPHDLELGANPEWDTTSLRVSYQSLTTPLSVYDVDVVTGERVLRKQTPTPGVDLDPVRVDADVGDGADGTSVPVDVVRHVDTPLDGTAPGVVYGYGSYEISMPPWFSVMRLSLLDRGVVWVLVHPRGGGELGRRWYLDGKLLNKRNTFTDTLAATEHVVAERLVDPQRVAIRGGSAGGLLVGACITMRPELFRAAVAEVPFVDVVTTMSDPTLPLTSNEWEEWGDPRAEPFASYMSSYSPYDNTVAGRVPGDVRHRRAQRPTRQLPRAGEVGRQAARRRRRARPAAAPQDADGRRPRRPERSLRRLARRGPHHHVPPERPPTHPSAGSADAASDTPMAPNTRMGRVRRSRPPRRRR